MSASAAFATRSGRMRANQSSVTRRFVRKKASLELDGGGSTKAGVTPRAATTTAATEGKEGLLLLLLLLLLRCVVLLLLIPFRFLFRLLVHATVAGGVADPSDASRAVRGVLNHVLQGVYEGREQLARSQLSRR